MKILEHFFFHFDTISSFWTIWAMTKPTKWSVCPAKTQISLGICPVWSESSLSTWRKLWSLATHWAHSEDSDQTGRMPRLIWVFTGHTCHFIGFVLRRLSYQFIWASSQKLLKTVFQNLIKWFTVKILNIWTPENCCNYPKIWTLWLYHRVMSPKNASGMANSVEPDQTAPLGAVWSGSTLLAQT